MDAFWIILTGSMVAICCGMLGCYLILRKMAMVGDAISHAVLPGIILAYVITESRSSVPMLIGAAAVGLLTTFLIEWLSRKVRLQSDASIGITFTFLFAIGIILTNAFTGGNVDIDQECVLYGDIINVPHQEWFIGENQNITLGPVTTWIMGGTLILVLCFIFFNYKALFITTFNPEYALSIGISTALFHYALMGAVSLTTVVSFESVGAILVVAFLVTPPATAYLITDKLPIMLGLTAIFGIVAAAAGYLLAWSINGSVAGAMASVAGGIFFIVFLVAPRRGALLAKFKKDVSAPSVPPGA